MGRVAGRARSGRWEEVKLETAGSGRPEKELAFALSRSKRRQSGDVFVKWLLCGERMGCGRVETVFGCERLSN